MDEELLKNMSDDVKRLNPGIADILKGKPASKYGNVRTVSNRMTFDSGREASRVSELILLEEQGEIWGLRLQVPFKLPGKIKYIADAVYLEIKDDVLKPVIEDVKGYNKDKVYRMKRKLFRETYGIDISET